MRRALFTLVIFLTLSIVGCDSMSNKMSDTSASPKLKNQATNDAQSVAKKSADEKLPAPTDTTKSLTATTQSTDYGTRIEYKQGSVTNSGGIEALHYANPSYYQSGYVYTAVLTPQSGDPDLHLYQQNPFAKLDKSENYDLETDMIQFTTADSSGSPSEIQLDAIGRGDGSSSGYVFELYRKQSSAAVSLIYPLNGSFSPSEITGYHFGDHWENEYCGGYEQKHTGADLDAAQGDQVYAAAGGYIKVFRTDTEQGGYVILEHSNGDYTTSYLHVTPKLSKYSVGDYVPAGNSIATIAPGNGYAPHLHFHVRMSSFHSPLSYRGSLPAQSCSGEPGFPEHFIDPESDVNWTG